MNLSTIIDFAPGILAIVAMIATAAMWKQMDRDQRCWSVFGVMFLLLTWSYMNSFEKVFDAWESPQYSHGYLIPLFTAALLFLKKKPFIAEVPKWQQGVGLAIVVIASLIRNYYGYKAIFTPDRLMYIPALIGCMMIIGGLPALKWSALPISFLGFAYPLPEFAERVVLRPLKSAATWASRASLETLGVECYTEGNRIKLDGIDLGVVDACSGLRMFTIFLALAVGIALVSRRPIWERLVMVFPCSIMIALAANSIRITLTGLAYLLVGGSDEMAGIVKTIFHDFAGLVMMPIALGLLALVYQVLSRVIIEEDVKQLSPLSAKSS